MGCLEELSICMNQECKKPYNLESRKRQTEEYSQENTAHLYYSDRCWIFSTNGKEEATKEVIIVM